LETGRDCAWNWIWTWLGNLSKALVAFVPPVSIKDRPLHWTLVKSQTEREGSLLSCRGFRLFPDRLSGVENRWRSKHYTEAGPAALGAWSPSLDGDLDLSTKPGRQSTEGYAQGSRLSANRCASHERDGDVEQHAGLL
jgi:hypothetical protein